MLTKKKIYVRDKRVKGGGYYRMQAVSNDRLHSPLVHSFKKEDGQNLPGVELKEHQTRVAKRLRDQKGIIVYHGLGSGKTLTSINAAEEYGGAMVVVPASLRENFKKEIQKSKAKGRYDVLSYEQFTKQKPDLKGRVLILDEAHRIRESSSKRSQALREQAKEAHKIIALTGTPIVNKPSDASVLINMIAGDKRLPTLGSEFKSRYVTESEPNLFNKIFRGVEKESVLKNKSELLRLFGDHVDYHETSKDDYPTVKEEVVPVGMTREQKRLYKLWEKEAGASLLLRMSVGLPPGKEDAKDLNAFINMSRQISNTSKNLGKNIEATSPKADSVVSRILKANQKSLVYSNYLDSGIKEVADRLADKGISYGIYDGSLNDKKKKKLVEDYNNNLVKVLLVSSAGSEGLDLKGVRQVHIMEPHWNNSKIEQVIGRAVRYQSHSHLPEGDRNVTVFRYISKIPTLFGHSSTADEYLTKLSQRKNMLNEQVGNLMKKASDRALKKRKKTGHRDAIVLAIKQNKVGVVV